MIKTRDEISTDKHNAEVLNRFLNSERGKYIVGQALVIAVRCMKRKPMHMREVSNIADMEYLIENAFPLYKMIKEAEKEFQRRSK